MNPRHSRETQIRAVRLYREGRKAVEIAAALGVSKSSVLNWLKDPSLDYGPVAPPSSSPLRPVTQAAGELIQASVSDNTRRAYLYALSSFDTWFDAHPSGGVGITDALLAEYLTTLYEAGKAPATCTQVVAAVKFRAKLQETSSPVGPMTDRILSGIRRKGRNRGRGQVQGVSLELAEHVADQAAADGTRTDLRDAAIIAVMSEALLRISEAAALTVGDVAYEPDGSGRLTIRSSKTDQEGRGAVQFLGPTAVERIRAWRQASGIKKGPLFRRFFQGGRFGKDPLSTATIREIIQFRCARAGVEGHISGHSLRVGAAQSLAAGGASLVELQNAGRWTSPQMPGHYTRSQQAAWGAVARIRHQHPEARPCATPRKTASRWQAREEKRTDVTVLERRRKAARNKNTAKRYPPEVKEQAVEMYVEGQPIGEIAKKVGAPRQTVRFWLEKAAETEAAELDAEGRSAV